MKQKLIRLAVFFGILLGVSSVLPSPVAMAEECVPGDAHFDACMKEKEANEPKDGAKDCGGVRTSIIGGDICKADSEGGVIFSLLTWALRIMTAGVGIAAVGGVAYGALLYTSAENKPEQTKKAIGVITNVVIGIVAYAIMAVFLNFLIPGGVFNL